MTPQAQTPTDSLCGSKGGKHAAPSAHPGTPSRRRSPLPSSFLVIHPGNSSEVSDCRGFLCRRFDPGGFDTSAQPNKHWPGRTKQRHSCCLSSQDRTHTHTHTRRAQGAQIKGDSLTDTCKNMCTNMPTHTDTLTVWA